MQVVHRLPSIVTRIYDDPITAIQLLVPRNLDGHGHQVAHQRTIFNHSLRG